MFTFPGQRPNEKILAVIRKHPIVYLRILIIFLLVSVMPIVIFINIWLSYYPFATYHTSGIIAGLFSCIYILYGLLLVCIAWINEEFDIFIITNERLIDITQITLLRRNVSSTPLEQIQDTTSNVHGFLPTLVNYGNLTVQTAAGDASDFFIDHVSDPARKARDILNWAHEKREGKTIKVDLDGQQEECPTVEPADQPEENINNNVDSEI